MVFKLSAAITLTPQTSINKPETILFTIDIPMLQALMPRFAQGPPHLVLTSHGSLDPRTSRTCLVSNTGRGKSLKNGSLRISQLTNKSTPTMTDASHGLHMPESQNDSDTSIIRSSALAQASSSLSMVCTRAWLRTSSLTNFYFCHGLRGPRLFWSKSWICAADANKTKLALSDSTQSFKRDSKGFNMLDTFR